LDYSNLRLKIDVRQRRSEPCKRREPAISGADLDGSRDETTRAGEAKFSPLKVLHTQRRYEAPAVPRCGRAGVEAESTASELHGGCSLAKRNILAQNAAPYAP
jgi:hypothetical protein